MTEPLIQGSTDIKQLAAELREMADRMELNANASFGGAFVIIPPAGGEVIKTLIIDSKQDPAQYWSIIKTKADMALMGLDEQQRNTRAFR